VSRRARNGRRQVEPRMTASRPTAPARRVASSKIALRDRPGRRPRQRRIGLARLARGVGPPVVGLRRRAERAESVVRAVVKVNDANSRHRADFAPRAPLPRPRP
jgi:hypothetical protein